MSDTYGNIMKESKKKRLSKKTKKGWRKGSDIKDVEEYLEQVREDERLGVKEKSNNLLFFIDDAKKQSEKQDKKSESFVLPCHRALIPDSSVPPLHISHRVHKDIEKRKRKTEIQQPKKKQEKQLKPASSLKTISNVWGTGFASPLLEGTDEHFATVCKVRRVKPPSNYNVKPSVIQSLEAPHPGASYNPTAEDHQDLMKKAYEVELKKEKEERRLKLALDDLFPLHSEKPDEASMLKELSEGLTHDDKAVADDGDMEDRPEKDSDDLVKSTFHVGQNEKKTEKQRRKEKERLQKEKDRLKAKKDKLIELEKFRLKSIKKDIKEREIKLATRAAWKALDKEEKQSKPKRLGKLKYEEPKINLKLQDELVDSLRLLKPEGHVAEIIFNRLQKKNVIETRKRAKPLSKMRSKLIEKRAHREIKA